jgi:Predicted membrane protein
MSSNLPRRLRMLYAWIKTLHIVFVIAWMAAVFYLPRILINIAEAGDEAAVRKRLLLMGRRLYRFGHVMFGIAFLFGLGLWLGFGIQGGWLWAKLALVALILIYYILSGRMLKAAEGGWELPSARRLRWFNELPVFLLVAVVWLVIAKPF